MVAKVHDLDPHPFEGFEHRLSFEDVRGRASKESVSVVEHQSGLRDPFHSGFEGREPASTSGPKLDLAAEVRAQHQGQARRWRPGRTKRGRRGLDDLDRRNPASAVAEEQPGQEPSRTVDPFHASWSIECIAERSPLPSSEEAYFDHYGDLELQRRMVTDEARTRAFVEAVERLAPGRRVLDLGCGTGILAMAAARAGAESVLAIDRSPVAQVAANLVKAHGYGDRVQVLRGDVRELEVEPVDLLVSEWLGNFAFVEDMWPAVVSARDRLLAPKGLLIPGRVRLWIAPVDDSFLYFGEGPGAWRRPVCGFDLSALERLELGQGHAQQTKVEPSSLMGPPVVLTELDAGLAGPDACEFDVEVDVELARGGSLVGWVAGFDLELAPELELSTRPQAPFTHWQQTFLPWPAQTVEAGQCRLRLSHGRHPEVTHTSLCALTWGEERIGFHIE